MNVGRYNKILFDGYCSLPQLSNYKIINYVSISLETTEYLFEYCDSGSDPGCSNVLILLSVAEQSKAQQTFVLLFTNQLCYLHSAVGACALVSVCYHTLHVIFEHLQ